MIVRLNSDSRVVLVNRVLEDYHTCLKCVDDNGYIDPNTQWVVSINGIPFLDETVYNIRNGTLHLIEPDIVIPGNGRDIDVVANCYLPDQSLNRNISLYSDSMLAID